MKLTSAFAAAVLAFTTATSAPAAPAGAALPYDERVLRSAPVPTTATVPADQLGQDSTIAVVTKGNAEMLDATGLERSLEVITPDGMRHPVWSVALRETPAGWYPGDFVIADWRPELHTALLRVSLGENGDKAVSYDVTTGTTREVALPQEVSSMALNPDGTGLLVTTYSTNRRSGRAATLSWEGVTALLPARADGISITSIYGHILVTNEGRARRWWVTDLVARSSASIATPGWCQPHRWADADSIVATCSNRRGSQLRQVDLDGTSTPLGIRHTEKTRASGPDVFNDDDVRVVQGKSWYESFGGCGGAFLTRQTAAGTVRMVRVPGREGALSLVGTRGGDLVIAHEKDDCASAQGARAALTLFNPVTRTESVLTELRRSEAWRDVRSATAVRAWAY